jgi:hypothetical protein
MMNRLLFNRAGGYRRRTRMLLLWLPALLAAVQSPAGDFRYGPGYNGYWITGYDGPGGEVVIPSVIDTMPVTGIDAYAFSHFYSGDSPLTGVTIPLSVKTISHDAFYGCPALQRVDMDNGVTEIDYYAFADCAKLSEVTLSENLTYVGMYAFAGSGIPFAALPGCLTQLGAGAFSSCTNLIGATLSGLTNIPVGLFWGCTRLEAVAFGQDIASIDAGAFEGCTNLLGPLNLPSAVTTIGHSAFRGCGAEEVRMPEGVRTMGTSVFRDCRRLEQMYIPDQVTDIREYAFSGCSNLAFVYMGDQVTNIEYGAFFGCGELEFIHLPPQARCPSDIFDQYTGIASAEVSAGLPPPWPFKPLTNVEIIVTGTGEPGAEIPSGALWFCGGLTRVVLRPGIAGIGANAMGYCGRLTDVSIPDSVTNIGYRAFSSCTALAEISVGSGVARLDDEVFYGCTNLRALYFKGDAPAAGEYIFENAGAATVYYRTGTTGWETTYAGLPTALWNPALVFQGGMYDDGFGFNLEFPSDITVVVEVSTNLSGEGWSVCATNRVIGGSVAFRDPAWTNRATGFYRVTMP